MTEQIASIDSPTPTDDEPTQPCADTVALGLLWQTLEQIGELNKQISALRDTARELEKTALRTMPVETAVIVCPGLMAIVFDLDEEHPIDFYPVEGQ